MASYRRHPGKLVDDSLSAKRRLARGFFLVLGGALVVSLLTGLLIFLRVHR